ncbi:MAG TPA: HAMP domain-containing sensor histidine kinase [Alloacidobacterium sp.]|nr:HAMP domain-containing sensor histidine kinase [Alloacidobacterium sp.]
MLTLVKHGHRRSPLRGASFARKFAAAKRGSTIRSKESLHTIAHDARNVVAALELCCDLLAEPGVLAEGHQGFAAELRAVASTSSALVEQLTVLSVSGPGRERGVEKSLTRSSSIDDVAGAVQQLKRPLAALAGEKVSLEMECLSCFGRVRLSHEDLTRILINLTRNAAEAMPRGGRIRVTVQQGDGGSFFDSAIPARTVLLCVQDSGPGIPREQIGRIFDSGFSTKRNGANHGLGLSIVRRLVEVAGGSVHATAAPGGGALFEVELPLIHRAQANSGFIADFPERANLEC